MRKRNVKKELEKYPCFIFENRMLTPIPSPVRWCGFELHHFITTQWQQTHEKEFEEVEHLQKLILMPRQMHRELHNHHSKFKEKYGYEIHELLFDWRKYKMISAKTARIKSDENIIKVRIEKIEKDIKKACENGRREIFTVTNLEAEVLEELDKAGFNYEKQANGYKITW